MAIAVKLSNLHPSVLAFHFHWWAGGLGNLDLFSFSQLKVQGKIFFQDCFEGKRELPEQWGIWGANIQEKKEMKQLDFGGLCNLSNCFLGRYCRD